MVVGIIERDYSISDPIFQKRYIGSPCSSFAEAAEVVYAHLPQDSFWNTNHWYNRDGSSEQETWVVCSSETGEVLKEFFVFGFKE
jgi:hypothetical protein